MSTRRRRTEPVRAGRTTAWLLATVFAGSLWGGATEATVLPQGPTVAGSTGRPGATFSYTPNTLTINQSASRVVIDWNSFNIGVGGTVTFAQASPTWIAFNRVNINPDTGLSPLSSILGTLHATGGVWLFSSGGIIFGSDAVVDVGSFAGVTGPLSAAGGISQLLNPGVTGITTITLDPPSAAGLETITVDPGARIGAASGFVVLQSESMIQNGAVSASDGAEYLVSERGQISFTNTGSSQQLQGAQAMVVAGQDRPSLTLGGATTAAWVGIDTPGGALQRGYHELINLDGVIDATGVKPGSADDGVVLLVGDDLGPAAPGYTGSSIGINAAGGTMDAVNGISISTDGAQLGRVRAGGSLDVDTYGDVTTTAPISVGGGALIDSAAGSVALNADITADGLIYVAANAITVGRDVTLHSDALGAGQGGIVLSSAGDITADPASNLVAGASAGDPDDPVSIRAGSGASGGNIVLGGAWGTEVFVQSQSHGVATQGSITLAGAVDGVDGVNVLINNAEAAGAPAGDLRILGDVASGGVVDVEDTGSGAMVVGSGASLTSSGSQVFLYSGGNTTVSSGAKVTGVSVLDYTVGDADDRARGGGGDHRLDRGADRPGHPIRLGLPARLWLEPRGGKHGNRRLGRRGNAVGARRHLHRGSGTGWGHGGDRRPGRRNRFRSLQRQLRQSPRPRHRHHGRARGSERPRRKPADPGPNPQLGEPIGPVAGYGEFSIHYRAWNGFADRRRPG